MQIKTKWKYHLTLVRMAIIKKSTSNNAGEGVGKKESSFPPTLLVRMQTGAAAMENSREVPYKTRVTYNPTPGQVS